MSNDEQRIKDGKTRKTMIIGWNMKSSSNWRGEHQNVFVLSDDITFGVFCSMQCNSVLLESWKSHQSH